MRGTMCHRDTMKLAGYKPSKITMLLAYLKKLLGIKSPSTSGISEYVYEYDYLKARYFGGKGNGNTNK